MSDPKTPNANQWRWCRATRPLKYTYVTCACHTNKITPWKDKNNNMSTCNVCKDKTSTLYKTVPSTSWWCYLPTLGCCDQEAIEDQDLLTSCTCPPISAKVPCGLGLHRCTWACLSPSSVVQHATAFQLLPCWNCMQGQQNKTYINWWCTRQKSNCMPAPQWSTTHSIHNTQSMQCTQQH